uniref:Uncharacterized protein pnxM n=1 Tax=Streptomyces sp. TA-0256 TaxID=573242 RepID=E5RLM5_9ACTN|nr:hypothetical protein [Streptomyces sp. TA-0256]
MRPERKRALRRLARALGLSLCDGLRVLGSLYVVQPPWPPYDDRTLAEPPPGSPERLDPGAPASPVERQLFDQLGRDLRWPAP